MFPGVVAEKLVCQVVRMLIGAALEPISPESAVSFRAGRETEKLFGSIWMLPPFVADRIPPAE